jgi:HEAT repeat protein
VAALAAGGKEAMSRTMNRLLPLALGASLLTTPAWGYLGTLQSLGQVINDSRQIVVLQVDRVNREKQVITWKKVADLKGTSPASEIKHHVAGGEDARHGEAILQWAEPGNIAIFFHNGTSGLTCIGHAWYECAAKEAPWWTMTRVRSEQAYAYLGSPARLRRHVADILNGKQVLVTALDHNEVVAYRFVARAELPHGSGQVWRIKAGLTIGGWPQEGQPGAGDASDVPALLAALRHQDPTERAEAAQELGWIGRPAREAVAGLRQALKDPDGLVRLSAAEALATIDPDDPTALPALIDALKDRSSKVRRTAAAALGDIGPEARVAVAALAQALKDADLRVRWTAAEALGQIGPLAAEAVPALVEGLKDESLRSAAAGALGAIGPAARGAVPALVAGLKDAGLSYRWTVVSSLARIGGPGAKAAVPFLIEAITNKPDIDRKCYHALILLEFLGPDATDAAPAVIDGIRSGRFQRGWVMTTLANIDPKTAVPFLIADLKNPDPALRKYAAAYLGFSGPLAKDALPALEAARRDPDPVVPRIVAWAEPMIRGDFKKAVPLLLRGLKEAKPGSYHHRFCGEALERLGPEAKDTVPTLAEALGDSNPRVRRAAAAALRCIGPDAADAIPSLRKLLRDEDRSVRAAAALALEVIRPK